MSKIEVMTDKEKFEGIGEFIKLFGKESDNDLFKGDFSMDFVPNIHFRYVNGAQPKISVVVNDRMEYNYTQENVDELVEDLKEKLTHVGGFLEWLGDDWLWAETKRS